MSSLTAPALNGDNVLVATLTAREMLRAREEMAMLAVSLVTAASRCWMRARLNDIEQLRTKHLARLPNVMVRDMRAAGSDSLVSALKDSVQQIYDGELKTFFAARADSTSDPDVTKDFAILCVADRLIRNRCRNEKRTCREYRVTPI
ncbi:MAG: hypothetical protein IPP90_21125 [Gemmatimonadaceae bacterium]|nr:hypothetical protein [Gemmatimonadaceae bacterium]